MRSPLIIFLFIPIVAFSQINIGRGMVHKLYQANCAICHGKDLEGGLGSSLRNGQFIYGSTDDILADHIRNGIEGVDMPAFGEALTEEQIRSLVIYIREAALLHSPVLNTKGEDDKFKTQEHDFKLNEMTSITDDSFWSVADLPGRGLILTEIGGSLRIYEDGKLNSPIKNTPKVLRGGQGGLLDVLPHPDYEKNGWVYISFAKPYDGVKSKRMTSIVRGKVRNNEWVDEEIIYSAPEEHATNSAYHFGSRFVLKDGYLFFSIGDRGKQDLSQDLSYPNGSIMRLYEDGTIPEDNPFVGMKDKLPEIWSYGHRNPQGLATHPVTGKLWAGEHGPRGGDELNIIEKGNNYGWPVITHGMNYNGSPITGITEKEGMEQPIWYWTPSIAPCGMDFYQGADFPKWKNDLFVGGLSSRSLHRIKIENGTVIEDEILFQSYQRVRDVHYSADGFLYLILDDRSAGTSSLYRIDPI